MTTTTLASRLPWRWPLALLAVTLLALALRWYYVTTAMVLQPFRGDATQYYAYAWNLVHHATFAKNVPGSEIISPDNYRDPGYPLFLAIWMKLLGTGETWYAAVLLCQAFLGALTVTVAVQVGKYFLPSRWAFVAGLLMALWPHSITITSYLLSETLFGFLCTLSVLLCAHALGKESPGWAVVAGLMWGLAALTNAVLLPFGILLASFLVWRRLASPKVCIALAIGALALPGAWSIRNSQIGSLVGGSSSMARALQNLEQGSRSGFQPAWRDSILGDENAQANAQIVLHKVDEEYRLLRTSPMQGATALLQRFARHPMHYAAWYLFEKPCLFWGWSIQIGQGDIYVFPTANSPFGTQPIWIALAAICHASNLLLMLLALASLFFAWSKRQTRITTTANASHAALVITLCLSTFVTLVYTALQAEPRYSIPFRSMEILLATTTAYGASIWWRYNRRLATRTHP
ncbi:MAG: ArnT family glycosyltransferase [Rhodanobacter sp.]